MEETAGEYEIWSHFASILQKTNILDLNLGSIHKKSGACSIFGGFIVRNLNVPLKIYFVNKTVIFCNFIALFHSSVGPVHFTEQRTRLHVI